MALVDKHAAGSALVGCFRDRSILCLTSGKTTAIVWSNFATFTRSKVYALMPQRAKYLWDADAINACIGVGRWNGFLQVR